MLKIKKDFIDIAALLPLLIFYVLTLAQDISWFNVGSDSGDLITAAATGGIAHPSGYPLYLLLARLFQQIPFGTLAWRTNLMSALFMWMAALLVKFVVDSQTARSQPGLARWLSGIVSAYAFGLAPLVWSQAVITEVYALNAFFTILLIWLSIQKTNPWLLGLICGLALGNHLTILLLVPAVTLAARIETGRVNLRALLAQFACALITVFCLYTMLIFRARMNPPINWENPVDLGGLWRLVSASMYRSYYWRGAGLLQSLQDSSNALLQQFGLLGLAASMGGLVYSFRRLRIHWLLLWNLSAFSIFSVLYTPPGAEVYLIPSLISLAVWLGFGIQKITEMENKRLAISIASFFAVYFGFRAYTVWPLVDASHDSEAEMFGRAVMEEVPKEALVFTHGDKALFTLWYFHFALGERPDLFIVSEELLGFAWYRNSLAGLYPELKITDQSYWPSVVVYDNPDIPVCRVVYESTDKIKCE